jgi:hypothetical protein
MLLITPEAATARRAVGLAVGAGCESAHRSLQIQVQAKADVDKGQHRQRLAAAQRPFAWRACAMVAPEAARTSDGEKLHNNAPFAWRYCNTDKRPESARGGADALQVDLMLAKDVDKVRTHGQTPAGAAAGRGCTDALRMMMMVLAKADVSRWPPLQAGGGTHSGYLDAVGILMGRAPHMAGRRTTASEHVPAGGTPIDVARTNSTTTTLHACWLLEKYHGYWQICIRQQHWGPTIYGNQNELPPRPRCAMAGGRGGSGGGGSDAPVILMN